MMNHGWNIDLKNNPYDLRKNEDSKYCITLTLS